MQESINNLLAFADNNGTTFSHKKSIVTVFSRTHEQYKPSLFMHNYELQMLNVVKILGLNFDKKLNWNAHINKFKADCVLK